jgi:16S rRNA (adenine1518-N6/adenine1519-N6)-dimethyltransferase
MVAGRGLIKHGSSRVGGSTAAVLLPETDKSLGQHWLTDDSVLESIVGAANISKNELVVEIGPGPGYLTEKILQKTNQLIAVEFDEKLYNQLEKQFKPDKSIKIINEDILKFNFSSIEKPYKIVANIPYYLTSNLLRILSETTNKPETAVVLIQKEVAERINSRQGHHSKLSIFIQNVYETSLGPIVPAEYFTPPPKVDSQVIILQKRPKELVPAALKAAFTKLVKAGFSEKRKKLRSSLSGGLMAPKEQIDNLLEKSKISPNARAQELSINNWVELSSNFTK